MANGSSPRSSAGVQSSGQGSPADRVERSKNVDPDELMQGVVADLHRQLLEVSEWSTALVNEVEEARAELERMHASRSWRLTAPLRYLAEAWHSRSAILTSPGILWLRGAMRRLPLPERVNALKAMVLHHAFGAPTRRVPPGAVVSNSGPRHLPAPGSAPQPPAVLATDLPDIFVWSQREWQTPAGRPQHLARELARAGHRVLYISATQVEGDSGLEAEALDDTGRLFGVRLHVRHPTPIRGVSGEVPHRQLLASIGRMLEWTCSTRTINLVQHPCWVPLAEVMPNPVLVYEWPEWRHATVEYGPELVAFHQRALHHADLVVVTSSFLARFAGALNRQVALIPHASDERRGCLVPSNTRVNSGDKRVVGCIAPTEGSLDIALIEAVARAAPDAIVVIPAECTASHRRRLSADHNIVATEGTGADWLVACDVAILPHHDAPFAAVPAEVYECLAAGKPVVSVDLLEMRSLGELVHLAGSADGFVSAVRECLTQPGGETMAEARRKLARQHTWAIRADTLRQRIDAVVCPFVSIIVVTHNNLALTRRCLESIDAYTFYAEYEVTVVDNASTDGTREFLRDWAADRADRRCILNPDNRGFAAANNQGLAAAKGEYFVLLNNDTVVTNGWLGTLVGHLRRDRRIGLISAVTNNIDNGARIEISYQDVEDMHAAARRWTSAHLGQTRRLPSAAFFSIAMPRVVYETVGPLDDSFSIGMFEDDDYCRRVEQTGRTIVCALDVFVHHQSAASFDAMDQRQRWELFERNKRIYEGKWGSWPKRIGPRIGRVSSDTP